MHYEITIGYNCNVKGKHLLTTVNIYDVEKLKNILNVLEKHLTQENGFKIEVSQCKDVCISKEDIKNLR